MLRNTGRVDLCVAGVSKICAVAVHLHSSRTVTCHSVRAQEERVAVTSRTYYYRVSEETLDAAGNKVSCKTTACTLLAVLVSDHDDV